MFVGSLPEMHLMSYGWMLYNNFWGLLALLGIVVFPFTWVLVTTVIDAIKKHGIVGHKASEAAVHTLFPTYIIMMAAYAIACIPSVPLNIDTWEYSQLCTTTTGAQQETDVMTPGNTGTPLDQARALTQANSNMADVQVPILWDLIMRLGAGMSRAMNSAGACPTNTTYLDSMLRKMSIQDPNLRAELGQFAADCYIPARAKYNQSMQSGTLDTVPTILDATDQDQYVAAAYRQWRSSPPPNAANTELFSRNTDPGYIGSQFFLTTPGLYAPVTPGQNGIQGRTLKASIPIAGWSYEPIRDCSRTTRLDRDGNPWCTSPHNDSFAHNKGSPTCDEWWTHPDRGLLHKLRQDAESSITLRRGAGGLTVSPSVALNNVITSINPADAKSDGWLADKIVATALVNDAATQQTVSDKISEVWQRFSNWGSETQYTDSKVDWSLAGAMSGLLAGGFAVMSSGAAAASAAALSLSLANTAVEFYTTAWIVREAYPVIQAYLMLFFIALMPLVMLGSMYDIARLYQLMLLFLGIMFLSPWRYVVEYLDERLFEIMFPDQWGTLGTDVLLRTKERLIIDVSTTLMYTLFPVILLWLIGMMGADGANNIKDAFSSGNLQKFGASMGKWRRGGKK